MLPCTTGQARPLDRAPIEPIFIQMQRAAAREDHVLAWSVTHQAIGPLITVQVRPPDRAAKAPANNHVQRAAAREGTRSPGDVTFDDGASTTAGPYISRSIHAQLDDRVMADFAALADAVETGVARQRVP